MSKATSLPQEDKTRCAELLRKAAEIVEEYDPFASDFYSLLRNTVAKALALIPGASESPDGKTQSEALEAIRNGRFAEVDIAALVAWLRRDDCEVCSCEAEGCVCVDRKEQAKAACANCMGGSHV